jgi:hypothetical protein
MKISTISRLASAAVVAGISTVVFAAPAHAMMPDPPGYGYDSTSSTTPSSTVVQNDGTNWSLIGAEAAAGVALVGAGAAGVILVRRHHHHTHLPHAA